MYPDDGYSTKMTIGAVYYALTISIYIYWGTYLSAEFKGAGTGGASSARCGAPASATSAILLLAIAIFTHTVGYDFFISAFAGNLDAPGASTSAAPDTSTSPGWWRQTRPGGGAQLGLSGLVHPRLLHPGGDGAAGDHDVVVRRPVPKRFASVNDRTHTPGVAILTTAIVSIPLAAWICLQRATSSSTSRSRPSRRIRPLS